MRDLTGAQSAVLAFFQGQARCGVYARHIQTLMAVPLLTPVPGDGALRGLFAYKGSIVPVFSFAGVCAEAETAEEAICLLLQEDGGQMLGITVSRVDQLYTEAAENAADIPPIPYGSARVKPVPTADGVILMLDIGRTYQALTR